MFKESGKVPETISHLVWHQTPGLTVAACLADQMLTAV